ncbi:MAG: transposase family protein [Thermomicrobiales bacterium]
MPVAPESLAAVLAGVRDPRQAAKIVYSLAALLALTVAALTAGQTSVLAVARWAARLPPDELTALGLPAGRVPAQSTLHRLFRELDVWALARQVQAAFAAVTAPEPPALQGVALDGKGHRGRLRRRGEAYAVHSVSAVCHTTGCIIAHEPKTEQFAGSPSAEVMPAVFAQGGRKRAPRSTDCSLVARHITPGWGPRHQHEAYCPM